MPACQSVPGESDRPPAIPNWRRRRAEHHARLGKRRLELVREEADRDLLEAGMPERPRTRGDCVDEPRPCPWAACRHHLYLDETRTGFQVNFPGREPWDPAIPYGACSLDAAAEGGLTLAEVSAAFGVTRERVRQIEERALRRLAQSAAGRVLADYVGSEGSGPTALEEAADGSDAPEGSVAGATRRKRRADGRVRDSLGLSRAEVEEAERWANEVASGLRAGLTLAEAQAAANEDSSGLGPEDPPV